MLARAYCPLTPTTLPNYGSGHCNRKWRHQNRKWPEMTQKMMYVDWKTSINQSFGVSTSLQLVLSTASDVITTGNGIISLVATVSDVNISWNDVISLVVTGNDVISSAAIGTDLTMTRSDVITTGNDVISLLVTWSDVITTRSDVITTGSDPKWRRLYRKWSHITCSDRKWRHTRNAGNDVISP